MNKSDLFLGWIGDRRQVQVPVDPNGKSLPWRETSLKDADALPSDAVAGLAERFDIDATRLEALGVALSAVLDPGWTPATLAFDKARGAKLAQRLFDKRVAGVAPQNLDWIDIEEVLKQFYVDREAHPALWRELFIFRHEVLGHGALPMGEIIDLARDLMERGEGKILLPSETDRRRISDVRRQEVVRCIVNHWVEWGRKPTWTTHFLTYDREGPLIEFIVAVVSVLTRPSRIVPNETVIKDLNLVRKQPRS